MPLAEVRHVSELHTDLISISEVCELLGVHRNTLYRLIHEQNLPAFKMTRGGRWRFRRDDIENWIEERQAEKRA